MFENNILRLKEINKLRKSSFFIPAYQRGYRWGKKEVEDLLNDINEFTPMPVNNTGEKTWYCLQPIIVKKISDNRFEVIDGQQRLTTIYLVLHFFNQIMAEEYREEIFSLEYETRSNIPEFLSKINKNTNNSDNVDYCHISEAFSAICKWFSRPNYDRNEFQSKFKFNTKIIWYEVKTNEPISIFTRINIGKIPLTNSELIKALFLNSSNFTSSSDDRIKLRQLEIASEWENIEMALQNDEFWYFLNEKDKQSNRIEFIFDLMNDSKDISDTYSTFRYFSNKFINKNEQVLKTVWDEVNDYYRRFSEWYYDRELYHKIGYLIYEGEHIGELMNASREKAKSKFKDYLDSKIRNKLKSVNIEELECGDKNIKSILLLYNIETMLKNKNESSRFPFSIFVNNKWDIEHITAVKSEIPQNPRQQENWINDSKDYIVDDIELLNRIKEYNQTKDGFQELYEDIVSYFNKDISEDEGINDISNLTLLDSSTNRGYKNAVFPVKRATIIKREKNGTYIPLCTKNVFLKYISEYPPKMSFWTQDDRQNYYNDLKNTLKNYLPLDEEVINEY